MKRELAQKEHLPLNITPVKTGPLPIWIGTVVVTGLFNWALFSASTPQNPCPIGPVIFLDPMFVLIGGFTALNAARLRGRGVTVSEEGLSPTFNEEILWTVPWERIGTIRREKKGALDQMFHPETNGPSVFDEQGVFLFHVPFAHTNRDSRAAAEGYALTLSIFWAEIRRLLPATAVIETTPTPVYKLPTKGLVRRNAIVAPIALSAGSWMVWDSLHRIAESAPGAVAMFLVSLVVLGVGITSGAAAVMGNDRLKHPERYDLAQQTVFPEPLEGPRLDRHLVRHQLKPPPIRLEEGRRYRVVDVEVLRHRISTNLKVGIFNNWAISLLATVLTLNWLFSKPFEARAWPLLLFWYVLAGACFFLFLALKRRAKTLDDTVIRVGDQIVIVRPDGSHLSFPAEQLNDDRKAKRLRRFLNSTDILRNGKTRYHLDRTLLFASQIPLEHEELVA